QKKLLEAMAMARQVVASAAAAEGIDAAPGEHLLVADDAPGLAAALCALFDDKARAAAMGRAARARMIARYGWDARLAPLGELLGLAA
ncbi:MAG TPA: glycosyltransferase, partial [Sphingopyxis sp.]|nr:glycosyltransferase [Sphingopyxis sp.]